MKEYTTDNIINICLSGHASSGKTMLSEAMLFNAKIISRELAKALPDSKIFLGGLGTQGMVDGELQEGIVLANKDTLDTLNAL